MQDRSDTEPETTEAELMTTDAEATVTGGEVEDSNEQDEDREISVQAQKLKGISKQPSSSHVEEDQDEIDSEYVADGETGSEEEDADPSEISIRTRTCSSQISKELDSRFDRGIMKSPTLTDEILQTDRSLPKTIHANLYAAQNTDERLKHDGRNRSNGRTAI